MSSATPISTTPLRGRAVVVTGSSRGIGRAVALRVAAEGADVVVNGTGTDPGALDRLVNEIARAGGRAVGRAGSVVDDRVAGALVATCLDEFGRLDALVNVAGIGEGEATSILDISPGG